MEDDSVDKYAYVSAELEIGGGYTFAQRGWSRYCPEQSTCIIAFEFVKNLR